MKDTLADFPVRPWFLNASFLHSREDKIKMTGEYSRVTRSQEAVPAGAQMRCPPGSGGKGPISGRRAGPGETERATGGAGETQNRILEAILKPGEKQASRRGSTVVAPARERG